MCYSIFRTVCVGLLREYLCEISIHTIGVKQLSPFITVIPTAPFYHSVDLPPRSSAFSAAKMESWFRISLRM